MKIGFIGAGNMASAIVEGMVQKGFSKPENIYLYDIATEKVQAFAEKIGAHALSDPQEVIKTVDTLILAVKPNVIKGVLLEAKDAILQNDPLIVSIAAGMRWSVKVQRLFAEIQVPQKKTSQRSLIYLMQSAKPGR